MRIPKHLRLRYAAAAGTAVAAAMVTMAIAAPGPADGIDITVTKTHTTDESGLEPGDPVTFEVSVTNDEGFTITIDTVVDDQAPGTVCDGPGGGPGDDDLTGVTLAGGATLECTYTLANYAPAVGVSKTDTVTVTVSTDGVAHENFLVLDDDVIDNESNGYLAFVSPGADDDDFTVQPFTASNVNDDIPASEQRTLLRFFADPDNIGDHIALSTGGKSDPGIFKVTDDRSNQTNTEWSTLTRPGSTTTGGFHNFFGDHFVEDHHNVGCGLGNECSGEGKDEHLDKVPTNVYGIPGFYTVGDGSANVLPLSGLVGDTVCAIVKDSDVSVDLPKAEGNYQGEYLGTVAFRIVKFDPTWQESDDYDPGIWNTGLGLTSDQLFPAMRVEILNAAVCGESSGTGTDTDTITTPTQPPPSPSVSPSSSVSPTPSPTVSPTPSPTVSPTVSPTPRPSRTHSPSPPPGYGDEPQVGQPAQNAPQQSNEPTSFIGRLLNWLF